MAETNLPTALETVTGRFIDLINPDPKDICITDIAWSLSRLARFNGHTIGIIPYSVAQHSIVVAQEIQLALDEKDHGYSDKEIRRLMILGLVHDASEAYTGDVSGPLKKHPELRPIIKKIEGNIQHAIYQALEIIPPTEEEEKLIIKPADILAQRIEAYNFMVSRGQGWSGDLPKVSIVKLQEFEPPVDSVNIYERFLKLYADLNY